MLVSEIGGGLYHYTIQEDYETYSDEKDKCTNLHTQKIDKHIYSGIRNKSKVRQMVGFCYYQTMKAITGPK